jgi:hypothetical protein
MIKMNGSTDFNGTHISCVEHNRVSVQNSAQFGRILTPKNIFNFGMLKIEVLFNLITFLTGIDVR